MADGPMSTPRRPAPRSRPAPMIATVVRVVVPGTGKAYVRTMDDAPIKVLVANDDGSFLEALRALIDRQPELSVVAAARGGRGAGGRAEGGGPGAGGSDVH